MKAKLLIVLLVAAVCAVDIFILATTPRPERIVVTRGQFLTFAQSDIETAWWDRRLSDAEVVKIFTEHRKPVMFLP